MNWLNMEIDHVKPFCLFDVSKDEELHETIGWVNTESLLTEVQSRKKNKLDWLKYRFRFIRAYQIDKISEEGLNWNSHRWNLFVTT